jgi:hypothetical protein
VPKPLAEGTFMRNEAAKAKPRPREAVEMLRRLDDGCNAGSSVVPMRSRQGARSALAYAKLPEHLDVRTRGGAKRDASSRRRNQATELEKQSECLSFALVCV